MKNDFLMKIPIVTLFTGVMCMILSAALPADSLADADDAIVGGTLLLHFCPILGIVGFAFAARNKNFALAFGNFLVIFAFPIMMFVGYFSYV